MAVAIFIVVSGFSLALAPMRNGGSCPGACGAFLRRRAWRILPAYWAALVLSVVVTGVLLRPSSARSAIAKGFAVHGLLLQDVIGSESPNGAFWSIAVEWQIYFVFPLILLLGAVDEPGGGRDRHRVVVLLAHAAAGLGGAAGQDQQVTPQFLALFALGGWAVRLGGGDRAPARCVGRSPRLRWRRLGAFVLIAATQGSEWVVGALLLDGHPVRRRRRRLAGADARGRERPARGVLASPTALWLGLFSYSIYLIHAPIVGCSTSTRSGRWIWRRSSASGSCSSSACR